MRWRFAFGPDCVTFVLKPVDFVLSYSGVSETINVQSAVDIQQSVGCSDGEVLNLR